MQSIAIMLNADKDMVLCQCVGGVYSLPFITVPENKDPMLFVYECAKRALGMDYIKEQFWYLKTEKCTFNQKLNIDHEYYIGTCSLRYNSDVKNANVFRWVPLIKILNGTVTCLQTCTAGYVAESLCLLEVVE